jgi:two-component SAPR family response regulator
LTKSNFCPLGDSLNLVLAGLRLGLKNLQVGEKWVYDDCSYSNGYTTDGKLIELDAQDFFQTIEDIKKISSSLQEQINEILAE